ncbi:hypothetical protein SDC9_145800 [bioreactor metagenome]|uniref:Uncharacterized protein n=1 Tax=bioreactor metagenome TaxID=1076179 RepID=A0A645ED74_9ZZZZ
MKNFMGVHAVSADSNSISSKVSNAGIRVGNCRQFSRSDKSKVAGIEKQKQPTSAVVVEADLNFPAAIKSGSTKGRSGFLKLETMTGFAYRRFAFWH